MLKSVRLGTSESVFVKVIENKDNNFYETDAALKNSSQIESGSAGVTNSLPFVRPLVQLYLMP